MLPYFLLQTGNPPAAVREHHGGFANMFGRLLAPLGHPMQVARSYAGESLPDPGTVAGAVITGSPGNITDQAPWMLTAAAWVREAHEAGLPLLGVCFGHQLMAYALGGEVGFHPAGREVGTRKIQLTSAGRADPWLTRFPPEFPAQLLHEQTVLHAPPCATVLARNDHDAHQILRYGPRSASVQFHPEFTAPIMLAYLQVMGDKLQEEGHDVATLRASVKESADAAAVLPAFFQSLQ